MKPILLLLLLSGLFACRRTLTPEEVESKLKESMSGYLNKTSAEQKTGANFTVKDVTWFPGKEFFECEFVVQMKNGSKDTTGIMKAKVSNDFSTVVRRL